MCGRSVLFISYSIIFFSHNKIINNIFNYDFIETSRLLLDIDPMIRTRSFLQDWLKSTLPPFVSFIVYRFFSLFRAANAGKFVRLSLSAKSTSYSAIFFSHNKSVNNFFYRSLLVKRTTEISFSLLKKKKYIYPHNFDDNWLITERVIKLLFFYDGMTIFFFLVTAFVHHGMAIAGLNYDFGGTCFQWLFLHKSTCIHINLLIV